MRILPEADNGRTRERTRCRVPDRHEIRVGCGRGRHRLQVAERRCRPVPTNTSMSADPRPSARNTIAASVAATLDDDQLPRLSAYALSRRPAPPRPAARWPVSASQSLPAEQRSSPNCGGWAEWSRHKHIEYRKGLMKRGSWLRRSSSHLERSYRWVI